MNLYKKYSKLKYYSEFDTEQLLKQIQKHIEPSVTEVSEEFQFIFHKMLYKDPCSYWNKVVYNQTYSLLETTFQNYGNQLEIDESIFNYFLIGYNSYSQLSDIILDLRNFNLAQEIKTRLYRLPTYTTLLESCLSNFLRVIAILSGKGIGKDYSSQNTLGQLMNVITSNGYTEISKNIDVNMRNAINHGKVLMKKNPGDQICFFYVENHTSKSTEMPIYEFDSIIDNTFDAVSAVFLSLVTFMNNHMILLKIDEKKKEYVSFAFLAMRFSLPGICCQSISDTGNLKQLNIEIEIENSDRTYIAQIATMLSILLYDLHNDYEQYMFNFSNPRMLNGWVRYKNKEVLDMTNQTKSFDSVLLEVIERQDFIIFDPSLEEVDLSEIKYFCFPNYNAPNFKINNLEDASNEQRKRLRARLYIGEKTEKQEILAIINQAIEWLKKVKNPPSPTMFHKYGDIPADSIYINVYINDERKNKGLYSSNENFVCFVDYNVDGITSLKDGGLPPVVWNSFYHEKVENINIAWRQGKYVIRQVIKTGRNAPCPCGSGLKFKKCCGK
ncbi:SEC-C domain-containing protein [Lacrimispora sp.]|uniref:YecA family protein n=1 Tax=Lacrimispora sp. TaxID=2719234 RepID=UPI0032E47C0F